MLPYNPKNKHEQQSDDNNLPYIAWCIYMYKVQSSFFSYNSFEYYSFIS